MITEQLVSDSHYQDVVNTIDRNVDYIDLNEFSHGMVDKALDKATKLFGIDVTNDLIDEFNLVRLGWARLNKEDNI